jgi:hypothetical protein
MNKKVMNKRFYNLLLLALLSTAGQAQTTVGDQVKKPLSFVGVLHQQTG